MIKIHGLDKIGSKRGSEPLGTSAHLTIRMIPSTADVLMNEDVQREDAKQLFEWMHRNVPHGTYTKLIEIICRNRSDYNDIEKREKKNKQKYGGNN